MSGSIYDWSSTAASNSNADGDIGWAEGQNPNTVNDSARQMMKRVRDLLTDLAGATLVTGTANALLLTSANAFTTLATGRIVCFKAASSNTGAATLNVNSIGAKSIRYMSATGDTDVLANMIRADGVYVAIYASHLNSSAGGWILVNPTAGVFANAISVTSDLSDNNVELSVVSTEDFALNGPNMELFRDSASPAASDLVGGIFLNGRNSAAGKKTYAHIQGRIESATSGSEEGHILLKVTSAGTLTETARITPSGVNIGRENVLSMAAAEYGLSLATDGLLQVARDGEVAMQIKRSTDGSLVNIYRAQTQVGSISVTTTATAYNTSSDYRLKENVLSFLASGAIIDALRPVSYNWKATGEKGIGFIAHEVQAVFPDAVTGVKDGAEMQAGDWSKLVPVLVAEIKDLRARLDRLGG